MFSFRRSTWWIVFAALIATAAKLILALKTYGTDDVVLYFQYGRTVNLEGLSQALQLPQFNLPPLAAEYPSVLMDVLARNRNWFPFALKLPGIMSYLGTVLALIWLRTRIPQIPTYGLVVFALSPVSILIDGFHGNLDSNMVFALVLAGCACALPRPNWILCAVSLALACQVKVVALLLAPVFWFFWMHRGRGWQFLVTTGSAVILGWLPGILANPPAFFSHVLAYGSVWGMWGITYFLHLTGYPAFKEVHWVGLSHEQLLIGQLLKLMIVAAIMIAAWRNRKGDASVLFGTIAFCWMAFFAFTPGMGMQYMVWFVPFLLVWNARWSVVMTSINSLILFHYYYVSCGGFPWWRAYTAQFKSHFAILVLPWLAFVACTAVFLIKRQFGPTTSAVPESNLEAAESVADIEQSAPVS